MVVAQQQYVDSHGFSTLPSDRAGIYVVLQTVISHRLYYGRQDRRKKPIVGFIDFHRRCRRLRSAIQLDDPYADWWAAKIRSAFDQAESQLTPLKRTLDYQLTKRQNCFALTDQRGRQPVRIDVYTADPLVHAAAYLLADVDHLVQLTQLARSLALLTNDQARDHIRAASRIVRRAYESSTGYRRLNITRVDVQRRSSRAIYAAQHMGCLPEKYLERKFDTGHLKILDTPYK